VSRLERRKHRWARWLGVLTLPCLFLARPAAADEGSFSDTEACREEPGVSDIESAKDAFRAGQSAFNEGAYSRAAELWTIAYDQDCTAHALLLNLAMAQELLGRPNEALHALRLFNRRAPDSSYAQANRKRIERLERAAREKARARVRRERDHSERRELAPPTLSQAEGDSLSLPLVLVVTGAAATLIGGALYAEARFSAAAAANSCGSSSTDCTSVASLVDGERARARAETAGWMMGAGLVTGAGGLLWHLLTQGSRPLASPGDPRLGLEPVLQPQAATLHWHGRF
jgi:tetratricopeptide (TPR) repeat protein